MIKLVYTRIRAVVLIVFFLKSKPPTTYVKIKLSAKNMLEYVILSFKALSLIPEQPFGMPNAQSNE